jgi:hypothetical protein
MLGDCLVGNVLYGDFSKLARASFHVKREGDFAKAFKSQASDVEGALSQIFLDQCLRKLVGKAFLNVRESQNFQQNIFRGLQAALVADFLLGSHDTSESFSSYV